ncbi:NACHT domain-containing protein (plasmid) [Streptomyces avidinii]|uniref:NACHT domain-containing protein n=1 Tax=Streptomyces avidinii TaxID=1895 RepID=UPI003863DC1F|nr:NACHT domain-containing protein [Streptomyces avidinii]
MRRVLKVGLLYVLMVGAFLAWYIARGHQVDYLIAVVSAFTGLLALPAAVIAVLRPRGSEPALARLEDVADQLAQGVSKQWEAEAQVRRLNDPFPLSVEWVAAEADLVEPWPHLRELARDWPGQSAEAASTWAVSPSGLAGSGADIAQVFERVPTRRLAILGEPGAGKTMLLIRLLLALLGRRSPGGSVPVLFPLAAWDPVRQDLYAWMADELAQDHPALRALVPSNPPQAGTGTQAGALLSQGLILPILDGLDELPQAVRARALHAINLVLPAGQPLVLSSRTAEYRSALTPLAGTSVLLNGAAGIRLLPLDPGKAAAYLERDAGGPYAGAAARWRRVTASLSADAPISQALSTPLGLFLARTIYNPRPDEHFSDLSDPDELLDRARFPTRQDIETHLFAAFVPAAYRPHSHHPTRWTTEQAQSTLTFLARHLQHNLDGTPNLAWWQLRKALPRYGRGLTVLAVGLMCGLPVGLMLGLRLEFATGAGFGLMMGLLYTGMAGFITSSVSDSPSSGIGWSWRGKAWLTFGLPIGLIFGLLFGLMLGTAWGLRFGLTVGFIGGLAFGLMGGIRSVTPDLDKTVGPAVLLARDRCTFWGMTLLGGIMAVTLVIPLGTFIELSPAPVIAVTLGFGYPIGLMLGLARSVWTEYLVTRIGLAVLGRVPWHFMSFLADAHERRGVLRQVGAVYQFRHIGLQRHLAGRQP